MALALNASVEDDNGGSSISDSITVASGDDLLVIQFGVRDLSNDDRVINSVTDTNGTPVEAVAIDNDLNNGAAIYYIVNPAVGTHTVTFNMGGACGFMGIALSTWTATGTPTLRETATNTGNSTDVSVSISPAQASVIFDAMSSDDNETITADGAQTELLNTNNTRKEGGSYKAVSAGATTMSWTVGDDDWVTCAAAFEDVAGGGGGSTFVPRIMVVT